MLMAGILRKLFRHHSSSTNGLPSQDISSLTHQSSSGLKNFLPTVVLIVLFISLLSSLYFLILLDYRLFLSIGPGGTPSTPAGYIKITLLHLIARSKTNVLIPPPNCPRNLRFRPYFKSLEVLPRRNKSRPRTAGLAPQRQITQKGSLQDVYNLATALRELVGKNPATIQEGRSCFEKHSIGLFLTPSLADYDLFNVHNNNNQPLTSSPSPSLTSSHSMLVQRNPTCGIPPEIAHMHDSEGSLHLTLHPRDAAIVIERGWGERHPLAGRWLLEGFMMIYAPKGEDELATVMEIVRAAAWWVGGVEVEI